MNKFIGVMLTMRLQKYLAQAGVTSRRKAEELILQGRVKVNGKIVTELGTKVEPEDEVLLDGRPVADNQEPIYLVVNKPPGFISTVSDPQGRKTVLDLLPRRLSQKRLYPVGRLDYDTSGLLILTNDGEFTFKLTHPRFHVPKTYLALVQGVPTSQEISLLESGVELEEGLTLPAKVRLIKSDQREDQALLELTLTEGRKRQVKRMCQEIGHPVLKLVRVKFGHLSLSGLDLGEHRELTSQEVSELLKIAEEGEES